MLDVGRALTVCPIVNQAIRSLDIQGYRFKERPDSTISLYAFFAVLISSYGLSSVCAFMMSPPIEADSHIKCIIIISQLLRIVN